jgi:hypothetical protein
MGGATNTGTLLNGLGCEYPIYFAGSQVMILDNFTPSFNMCIQNALSANFFSSRQDTSYNAVTRSSIIAPASTGVYNQIAWACNSVWLERPSGTAYKIENTFHDIYRGLAPTCTVSSYNSAMFNYTICSGHRLINSFLTPGDACTQFGDPGDTLQHRNNFYGLNKEQTSGTAVCIRENLNSSFLSPVRTNACGNINSTQDGFSISAYNSFDNRCYGSVNSIQWGTITNAGTNSFNDCMCGGSFTGRANTCNSYINFSGGGTNRDHYLKNSFATFAPMYSACNSMSVQQCGVVVEDVHNTFICETAIGAGSNNIHESAIFTYSGANDSIVNSFISHNPGPIPSRPYRDMVVLRELYATLSSTAFDCNGQQATPGLNSSSLAVNATNPIAQPNSVVVGFLTQNNNTTGGSGLVGDATTCNNVAMYSKDGVCNCCTCNTFAANFLLQANDSFSMYYRYNANNRSIVGSITNATTCCLSGGGLIAQCFTIKNLPTSSAGLPCGHVWWCSADCTLRIVTA